MKIINKRIYTDKQYIELLEDKLKKSDELVEFNVETTSVLTKRINKAIEYIENNIAVYGFGNKALPHWEFDDNKIQDLLKILKGEE